MNDVAFLTNFAEEMQTAAKDGNVCGEDVGMQNTTEPRWASVVMIETARKDIVVRENTVRVFVRNSSQKMKTVREALEDWCLAFTTPVHADEGYIARKSKNCLLIILPIIYFSMCS